MSASSYGVISSGDKLEHTGAMARLHVSMLRLSIAKIHSLTSMMHCQPTSEHRRRKARVTAPDAECQHWTETHYIIASETTRDVADQADV